MLTGNGSDGSEGIRQLSQEGGTVVVQEPATASYSGMPRAAINTGVVDFVLTLPAIPAALIALVSGNSPLDVVRAGGV